MASRILPRPGCHNQPPRHQFSSAGWWTRKRTEDPLHVRPAILDVQRALCTFALFAMTHRGPSARLAYSWAYSTECTLHGCPDNSANITPGRTEASLHVRRQLQASRPVIFRCRLRFAIDCGRSRSGSFFAPLLQCMDGYL